MQECFIVKDVMVMIHQMISDAQTYGSLSRTCKFMANIARINLIKRRRELKGLLPPIFLKSEIPFFDKENAFITVDKPIIPEDEWLCVYDREGQFIILEFKTNGSISFGRTTIKYGPGCHLLPITYAFKQEGISRIQYLKIENKLLFDTLDHIPFNFYADDRWFVFEYGDLKTRKSDKPVDGTLIDYTPTMKTSDSFLHDFYTTDHINIPLDDLSEIREELVKDDRVTWVSDIDQGSVSCESSSDLRFFMADEYPHIHYSVENMEEDVTTPEDIIRQRKVYYAPLRQLVELGIIHEFE